MDALEIQGRRYISSKRASELTGYAKDYVGQLAREGKIPGSRLGRAWYVDESAILGFAGLPNRVLDPLRPPAGTDNIGQEVEKTLYSVAMLQKNIPGESFKTWKNLNYLHDPSPLIPPLVENISTKKILEKTKENIVFPGIPRETPSFEKVQKNLTPTSTDGIIVRRASESPRTGTQKIRRKAPAKGVSGILYAAASFGAVAILIVARAFLDPSEWSFSSHEALSASVGDGFRGILGDYFTGLFAQGISLLQGFLQIIIMSFGSFFSSGLIFILNLFHLG